MKQPILPPTVLAEIADIAAAAYSDAMQSPERSRATTQDRWSAVVLRIRAELIERGEVFDRPRRKRGPSLLDKAA